MDRRGDAHVDATLGSLALLFGGIWLHERKGHSEAARAAVASAISGLYATILVATQAYDLIPAELGLALAAAVAGVGFLIAVRWSAAIVAAVGSLGALAAPILVGIGTQGPSIAFVAVALAATVAILVWQRWDWLALGAFAVSVPQLLAWVWLNDSGHTALVLSVLLGFWLLYLIAAFGFEVRARSQEALPIASLLLLLGSSVFIVACGFHVFYHVDDQTGGVIWLLSFAALHVALGALALRVRLHREVGALLIGTGLGLAALGVAEALDGPGLVLAWAAMSAALGLLATRVDTAPDPAFSDGQRLLGAAAVLLAMAIGHVLVFEAPPNALFEGVENLGSAVAAIAGCTVAALACCAFSRRINPELSLLAGFLAAASLVYLGSVVIIDAVGVGASGESRQAGQVWLSAFWTVTGLGAVIYGLVRKSASVRLGGLALLGLAIVKVWTYDLSELDELARVLSFVGLGLLLLVGAFAYQRIKPGEEAERQGANG